MDYALIRSNAQSTLEALNKRLIITTHERDTLAQHLDSLAQQQRATRTRADLLQMALGIVQQLVDTVSASNIKRVEELVNSALKTIFYDLDLRFRIISEIKRNQNTYRIAFYHNDVEGGIQSFGGGVLAVVALVLKVLFNLFAKRYPMIVLDESLSFLSEKYIGHASKFLKELSLEFNMPILLVTHQPQFADAADMTYEVSPTSARTVTFNIRTQQDA